MLELQRLPLADPLPDSLGRLYGQRPGLTYVDCRPGRSIAPFLKCTLGTCDAVDQIGCAAGVGLEHKVRDHVIARAECLHYDFTKASTPNFVRRDNQDENPATIRMRMCRCRADEGRA